MGDDEVAAELVAMLAEQKAVLERPGGTLSLEERREQREVCVRHADRLGELLDALGTWPGSERVGASAAWAAWLVAQHADTQLELQRRAVALMREAVAAGTADRTALAFLEDRVAVNEGRPQTYGTQIADVVDGEPVPWPCTEPDRLDERRALVGLGPFGEDAATYREAVRLRS